MDSTHNAGQMSCQDMERIDKFEAYMLAFVRMFSFNNAPLSMILGIGRTKQTRNKKQRKMGKKERVPRTGAGTNIQQNGRAM